MARIRIECCVQEMPNSGTFIHGTSMTFTFPLSIILMPSFQKPDQPTLLHLHCPRPLFAGDDDDDGDPGALERSNFYCGDELIFTFPAEFTLQ